MDRSDFTPGRRVKLTEALEPFFYGDIPVGTTGTVTWVAADWDAGSIGAMVRLDETFPALAEWDNEVYIGDRDDSPTHRNTVEPI